MRRWGGDALGTLHARPPRLDGVQRHGDRGSVAPYRSSKYASSMSCRASGMAASSVSSQSMAV